MMEWMRRRENEELSLVSLNNKLPSKLAADLKNAEGEEDAGGRASQMT